MLILDLLASLLISVSGILYPSALKEKTNAI